MATDNDGRDMTADDLYWFSLGSSVSRLVSIRVSDTTNPDQWRLATGIEKQDTTEGDA